MDLASLTEQLTTLRESALRTIAEATDLDGLAEAENAVLGRKQGQLTTILRGIGALPGADRPRIGALANDVRAALETAIAKRREELQSAALQQRLTTERIDPTLPGRPVRPGSLHPIAETAREIGRIFHQFGFVTYETPEVETDEFNFQALNIPPDHPARDLWDTLYVDIPGHLLRTHTSPG
ncbi:MAG: phenylalanine--tRNA ligase subunit alpha, partial [Candidatus Limnocylindrales bacterium]